ncbi:hypothetical protein TNCV_4124341 [Trichonephila clavipes]|nr:hypothetical protein TNCV_4124341 [Trichonephila clavipes]
MNRCPDLEVCLKRNLQCLRPEASLVLIYRPNAAGMKGRVDLAQPVNRTQDLWCGSTILYQSTLFGFFKAEMKTKVTYKPSVQMRTTCQSIRGRSQIPRSSHIQPVNQRRVSFAESAIGNYDPTPRSIQGHNPSVLQGNSSEMAFNFQGSQNAGVLQQGRNTDDLNFRGERQF